MTFDSLASSTPKKLSYFYTFILALLLLLQSLPVLLQFASLIWLLLHVLLRLSPSYSLSISHFLLWSSSLAHQDPLSLFQLHLTDFLDFHLTYQCLHLLVASLVRSLARIHRPSSLDWLGSSLRRFCQDMEIAATFSLWIALFHWWRAIRFDKLCLTISYIHSPPHWPCNQGH